MTIVVPVPITPAGLPLPDPADRATFSARKLEQLRWANNEYSTGSLALANASLANAQDAQVSATTATTKAADANASKLAAAASAIAADDSADIASAQAANVLDMDKRYLGAKASEPTLDNQGAALQTGANYYDTVLLKLRAWGGAAWVDGISAVAGVTSINGQAGVVTGIAKLAANTFTGDQSMAGNKVVDPLLKGTTELRATAAIASGVLALDLANAITSAPLVANITSITVANNAASATACQSHTLELTADGTQRTVVWPGGNGTSTLLFRWPGGTTPTLTATSGKRDTFFFKSVSQFLWDAYVVGQNT